MALFGNQTSAPCLNCISVGLPIVPVLYAVAPSSLKPTMPGEIGGDRIKSVIIDKRQYDYALRATRAGYIYLFYESGPLGANYWELFVVNEDGTMKRQPSHGTTIHPQAGANCGSNGHNALRVQYLVIEKPEQCGTVWVCYSQHFWTAGKLAEFSDNPSLRASRMQAIQPADWVFCPSHPHATEATQANLEQVLEYRPGTDMPTLLGQGSAAQVSTGTDGQFSQTILERLSSRYPINGRAGQAAPLIRQLLISGKKPDGHSYPPMLLALWDAVGIVHELKGYADDAAARVHQYQTERGVQITALDLIDGAQRMLEGAAREHVEIRYKLASDATEASRTGGEGLRKLAANYPEPTRDHYIECGNLLDEWENEGVPSFYTHRLTGLLRLASVPEWKAVPGTPGREVTYQTQLKELRAEVDGYVATRGAKLNNELSGATNDAWPKYEKFIKRKGVGSIEEFRGHNTEFMTKALALIDSRTADLVTWLESKIFIDSLQDYDQNDVNCGIEFEDVVSTALFGIGQCEAGAKKLDAWIGELKASPKNIVWRAFALNQKVLMPDVEQVLQAAKDNAVPFTEKDFERALAHIKVFKGLADTFKKAQSFFNTSTDAAKEAGTKAFGLRLAKSNFLLGTDRWVTSVGDRVYKLFCIDRIGDTVGEKIIHHMFNIRAFVSPDDSEKFLKTEFAERMKIRRRAIQESLVRKQRRMSKSQYRRALAQQLSSLEEPESVGAISMEIESEFRNQRKSFVSGVWERFLSNKEDEKAIASSGRAIKDVRLAAIVAMLEMGNLLKMVSWDIVYHGKTDRRTIATALASGASIVAGLADMAAVAAKSIIGSESLSYQKLKLCGGALSVGGSLVGTFFDLSDLFKEWKRGRTLFAVLYATKIVFGGLSIVSTAFTTFTYAAPLIERMSSNALTPLGGALEMISNFFARLGSMIGLTRRAEVAEISEEVSEAAISSTVQIGSKLAQRVVVRRLIFMGSSGWVTAALTALQVITLWIDDNELQKWCQRSAFGVRFLSDGFSDAEKEEKGFYEALHEVI